MGAVSAGLVLAMAFKLIEAAQSRWRAVNAPHLVALVRAGAKFENGKLSDVKEIFEAKAWNDAPGHFGARIAFDTNFRIRGWPRLDIARRIENELEYPGQIKVTVIRESRAVEFAK